MSKVNLGFLVSHRGTNMQTVIDACRVGRIQAIPSVVITNNPSCQALQRAERENIPAYVVNPKNLAKAQSGPGQTMLQILNEHQVRLVVLAGYMKKIDSKIIAAFRGRIINIHPSLLPKYGGQGMYGAHVHEAVLAAGESQTGVTIHIVEQEYDRGPILAQQTVRIHENDTVESLAARVLTVEHDLLVNTLGKILSGEISTPLTIS